MTEQEYRKKLEAIAELKLRGEDVTKYQAMIPQWEKEIKPKGFWKKDPYKGESMLAAAIQGFGKGATLGASEKIVGALKSIGEGTYEEERDKMREYLARLREAYPKTTALSHIAGSVAPAILSGGVAPAAKIAGKVSPKLAKFLLQKGLGATLKRGAVAGGVAGLGYGEREGIGGKIRDISEGVGTGVLTTGALYGVGKGLRKIPTFKKLRRKLVKIIDPKDSTVYTKKGTAEPIDIMQDMAMDALDEYNIGSPTYRGLNKVKRGETAKLAALTRTSTKQVELPKLRDKILKNINKNKITKKEFGDIGEEVFELPEVRKMINDLSDNPSMNNLIEQKFTLQRYRKELSKAGKDKLEVSLKGTRENVKTKEALSEVSKALDEYFISKDVLPLAKQPLQRLSLMHDLELKKIRKDELKPLASIFGIKIGGRRATKTMINKLLKTPSKWSKVLAKAAERGETQLALIHRTLYKRSAEYKDMIDNMNWDEEENNQKPQTEINKVNETTF